MVVTAPWLCNAEVTSTSTRRIFRMNKFMFSAICMGTAALGLLPLVGAAQPTCAKMSVVSVQEWPGDIINIVPWVAKDKGIYAKHCLDVKMVPLTGATAGLTGIVNNTIEFANGAMDSPIRARVRGLDVRLVANMYKETWSVLVARKGLSLPHLAEGYPGLMKDFVGKKIGVTQLAAVTEAYARSAFKGADLSADSATYLAVGGTPTAIPALRGATVDAAMMFGTGPELAEALGVGTIVLDFRTGIGPEPVRALRGATLSWSAYGPYIEKNGKVVAQFADANNEAIAWITDPKHRDEVYRIVGGKMPLPNTLPDAEATLKRIVDINIGLLSPDIPKSAVDGYNKYLGGLGQLKKPIPYDELVWKTARPKDQD